MTNKQPVEGLVCPVTKQPLYQLDATHVATADGSYTYLIENGIFRLKESKHHYKIIIPSRFASTRLPGKPLLEIGDTNLINTVVYTALQCGVEVIVATDHEPIRESVLAFAQQQQASAKVQVVMTDVHLQNGTERLAQAIDKLDLSNEDIIVNVQGDEPFFNPQIITDLVNHFVEAEARNPAIKMASIAQAAALEEVDNPNAVKVVTDQYGQALYFSRSPIPYPREKSISEIPYLKHAGVYCYRAGFVREYKELPMTPLAATESLEQLKVLENGYKIAMLLIEGRGFIGVDTAEDLSLAQQLKAEYWEKFATAPEQLDAASYKKFLSQFGKKA